MKRFSARLLINLAEILGTASLVLFGVFVFAGPVVAVKLNLSPRHVLYWDALLSLLFFAQHSLMVRRCFKAWLARRLPDAFHGAVYALASGVALALAMLWWQRSAAIAVALTGWTAWLPRAAGVGALVGFVWGVRSLRTFDTFGRLPVAAWLRGKSLPPSGLVVRGAYQWMRHPLMFFMLVLMWSNPVVTADRLLFNLLWSVWLVFGSFLEERDLLAEFGAPYRAYQRVVPMLLPWRGPAGHVLPVGSAPVPPRPDIIRL